MDIEKVTEFVNEAKSLTAELEEDGLEMNERMGRWTSITRALANARAELGHGKPRTESAILIRDSILERVSTMETAAQALMTEDPRLLGS